MSPILRGREENVSVSICFIGSFQRCQWKHEVHDEDVGGENDEVHRQADANIPILILFANHGTKIGVFWKRNIE